MRGHPCAAEDIGDQEIGGVLRCLFEPSPGVDGVHGDAGSLRQRQVLADELDEPRSASATSCREPGRVAAT